jgi:tetratricopeptide (TPR) repeat protein
VARADPSALARIADGIVEAGWLLALALVPVFFNIQSSRPFEPDKTALLRLLATLMAAAGLARIVEERLAAAARPAGRRWRDEPLLVCALVYLGAAALSTVFSIHPGLSLWGAHTRLEGLVTLLAHLTVFVAIATRLRRREQLDRLLDAVVAASVPVCVYGFVQRWGVDPLDWQAGVFQEGRISTTLGNPIFTGEYLVLTLPMTLAGCLWWWRRRGDPGRTSRLVVYGLAAAMQVVALGLTGSRGPWLGAATALAAFVLLLAALHGRRRLAAATLAAGVAALVFVAVLNVPGGPLEPLRRGAVLGRLGRLFDDSENRNPADRARVLVWRGALRLARLPAPIVVPGRGPDGAAGLRTIVGFGPETLQGVFGAVYDPAFARAERRNPDMNAEGASTFYTHMPDRSHNEALDSLVFGGIVGLLAHLLLHGAVQLTGLSVLGLAALRRERLLLGALCAGGAVALAVTSGLALSWAYLGAALPLGLVGGWMAFVLLAALRRREALAQPGAEAPLVAACTAALLGHFVSMQFGPAVVTGRLHFWALAGLLVALGRLAPAGEERDPPGLAWEVARVALPAAALGLVIAYGFAGLKAGGGGKAAYGTIALLSGVTIAAWVAAAARRYQSAALAAGLAAAVTAAFALAHLNALAATSQVRTMAELFASLTGHFTRIALLVLAAAIALGVALGYSPRSRPGTAGTLRLAAALAIALVLVVPPSLAGVNADVLRNFAATFKEQNRLTEAVGLYEEAIRLAPGEALHQQGLGEALLAGTRTNPPARGPELLKRAEVAFRRARELDPLGPDHTANLARLARRRSELETDPAAARRHAEESARLYAEAAALVPGNTLLIDESAELEYQRLGDFASAEGKLRRSLELDPTFDYTHAALGDLYLARARVTGNRDDYGLAASAFQQANAHRKSLKAQISLGIAYKEMGDSAAAIDAFEQALAAPPPPSTASALNEQLAGLYAAQGDADRAGRHATLAVAQASEKEKTALEARLRAAHLLPGS